MYTSAKLIKKIREEAGLTQSEFAKALEVSSVLIAMVEGEQKEVSKKLVLKLAEKINVNPISITPFLLIDEKKPKNTISPIERKLVALGEKMQNYLISDRAKLLKKYATIKV